MPIVEAIQYTGSNGWELRRWSGGKIIESPVLEPTPNNPTGEYVQVQTKDGTVVCANKGTWIIKDTDGTFFPVN